MELHEFEGRGAAVNADAQQPVHHVGSCVGDHLQRPVRVRRLVHEKCVLHAQTPEI